MKLSIAHRPDPHADLHIPIGEAWLPEIAEGPYDEIYMEDAHILGNHSYIMDWAYRQLKMGGVLDITVPLAGCPASLAHPLSKGLWTPRTFLYFQKGPHSIQRRELSPLISSAFEIALGISDPEANGDQFIRARCTKVEMEEWPSPNGSKKKDS